MSDLIVTKKIRMKQKDANNLRELSQLSNLNESEIIRTNLEAMKIVKSNPSKKLMNHLNKMIDTAKIIEDILKDAKESGNIDILSLKIYTTQLDKLISEVKEKNL